jgi:hypothetical protein
MNKEVLLTCLIALKADLLRCNQDKIAGTPLSHATRLAEAIKAVEIELSK